MGPQTLHQFCYRLGSEMERYFPGCELSSKGSAVWMSTLCARIGACFDLFVFFALVGVMNYQTFFAEASRLPAPHDYQCRPVGKI